MNKYGEWFQVFVKGLDGKNHVMIVDEKTLPIECLFFIDVRYGMNGELVRAFDNENIRYKIMFNGRYIKNSVELVKQGVQKECTLYFSVSSRKLI